MSQISWKEMDLGSIADVVLGGTPSTAIPEYWKPEIDWVTAKDISETSTAKIHKTERLISKLGLEKSPAKILPPLTTVIIARGATMGKCRMLGSAMALNQTCYGIIAKENYADPIFLYYYLSNLYDYFRAMAHGSVFDTVIGSGLRAIKVKFPPLPEQRAIAGILGALDDKIEVNRRMNATLESMAQAVFRRWFVENEEVGNWGVGRLGDVIKVNERSITKEYPNSEIEYIDISSVITGHLENTTPYSLANAPSRARRLVKHGDTIWSTVRPNRKSYLFISNPKANLIVSTGFAVLTPKAISPSYLYFWVTTDSFVDYLVSNADGSAYPAVGAERFADAEILMPPKDVLDKFESIAGAMLARIAHNEKESPTLASLRDSLLPKLMRGEVRVSVL